VVGIAGPRRRRKAGIVATQLKPLLALAALAVAVGTVQPGPVSGQDTWETTLQDRDLNGDGVADAFSPSGNSATVHSSGVNTHH
jgi:hypothetical protein